jgi:hypothetical protein
VPTTPAVLVIVILRIPSSSVSSAPTSLFARPGACGAAAWLFGMTKASLVKLWKLDLAQQP